MNTDAILSKVRDEREFQDAKFGVQNHPSGTATDPGWDKAAADEARSYCDYVTAHGKVTWREILLEEVYEALAEPEGQSLREELIQVAAVAVNWIECIDRREEAAFAQRSQSV